MEIDSRTVAVAAAYRRGWRLYQIAFAAGVTYQRIQQIIDKYESQFGKIEQLKKHPNLTPPGKFYNWKCAQCGKFYTTYERQYYCSLKCTRLARLDVDEEMVEEAIRMRRDGKTWREIKELLDRPNYQAIQSQIWKYLYMKGELNEATVRSIWVVKRYFGYKSSWTWLEKTTGLYLQFDGTILVGQPGYPDREGFSAWGSHVAK